MKRTYIITIICLTAVFYVGMWTTDLGASMYNIECATGWKPYAEGLVTRNVEPTVVYHMGLTEMTAAWLVLAGLCVWVIMKDVSA